jgi:hypothetical protein
MAETLTGSGAPDDVPARSLSGQASGECATSGSNGLLGGGCCLDAGSATMGRRARRARAIAGVGFLALAGAMSSRQLPGEISLWPAAVVPTWFGIAHLVSSVTGYEGCPELGAIPSVMLDRHVATGCGIWERIDRRMADIGP